RHSLGREYDPTRVQVVQADSPLRSGRSKVAAIVRNRHGCCGDVVRLEFVAITPLRPGCGLVPREASQELAAGPVVGRDVAACDRVELRRSRAKLDLGYGRRFTFGYATREGPGRNAGTQVNDLHRVAPRYQMPSITGETDAEFAILG